MGTYAEIMMQIEGLKKQAADQLRAEKAGNIQKVKAFMQQMNVTLEDMGCTGGKRRAKAEVRYRDPATGKGWSGRGRKPAWVVSALGAGRNLKDFAV